MAYRCPKLEAAPSAPPVTAGEAGLVAALFAFAVVVRTWRLYEMPMILHNDEMSVALSARAFLASPPPDLFGLGWMGLPNLHYFLDSLGLRLFGDNLFGARMSSAILGLFSLAGAYLLMRRLFGITAAILLLALTVPFHWHVHFSRMAIHNMWVGAATPWALFFFVSGMQSGALPYFVLSGVAAGIGMQSYFAGRIIPLLFAAWGTLYFFSGPARRRTAVLGTGTALLTAAVTFSPLLLGGHAGLTSLFTRISSVFVFTEINGPHVKMQVGSNAFLPVVAYQIQRIGQLFLTLCDSSGQYGNRIPLINSWGRWPFLGGLLYALYRLTELRWRLIFSWLLLTLVIGGVLTLDPPFLPRLIGISGIILALIAVPLAHLDARFSGGRRKLFRAGLAGLVGMYGFSDLSQYFRVYPVANPPEARDSIVRLLDAHREISHVETFFAQAPEVFGHEAYQFMAPNVTGENLNFTGGDRELLGRLSTRAPSLIVFPERDPVAGWLRRSFPKAQTGTERSADEHADLGWVILRDPGAR